MPTARVALLCAVAAAAGAAAGALGWRAFTPVAPFDVHVSGDGAAQIAAALFGPPGPPRAAEPEAAALEVVTFRRWQNVETMTGLMRVCGGACDGSAPVVVLRRPSPAGLTEVLFVDLGALGAGPALDRGVPMEPATLGCVVALIERHLPDGSPAASGCDRLPEVEAIRPRLRAL